MKLASSRKYTFSTEGVLNSFLNFLFYLKKNKWYHSWFRFLQLINLNMKALQYFYQIEHAAGSSE